MVYRDDKSVQIGTIIPKRPCFQLPQLPNIAPEVWSYIQTILKSCVSIRVLKSKKLQWRKFKSMLLLYADPPLLFVDGSDQVMIIFWEKGTRLKSSFN